LDRRHVVGLGLTKQGALKMGAIKLNAVEKWFGDLQVIKGVDLDIEDGEFVVFVGPSGCGKSTLLRMISGLEDTSRGTIEIDGVDVTDKIPSERGLAMVFQSYALYPHMSVRENIGFGLKTAGMPKAEIAQKVKEAAATLELTDYLDRKPKELSGGQRQRVAIGRSIVREPSAFLFDEPLSNLDAALRVQMRFEISKLHDTLKTSMIYVTHDQVEAMTLADKIVVLKFGEIMQVGSPRELYERPDNLFVAQFIGSPKMNVLPCSYSSGKVDLGGATQVSVGADLSQDPVKFGIRPEHLTFGTDKNGHIKGTLDFVEYLGADTFYYISTDSGEQVLMRGEDSQKLSRGETVHLIADLEKSHLFASDDQAIRP
jgi:multiple sugar transport system ATP-binding protein